MNMKITSYLTKHKAKFQQLVCLGALCTGIASAGSVVAAELKYYGELSKQLNIMNNILVSSLQSQPEKSLKSTKVDSLYLAGQGVVFTIKSASRPTWSRNSFSFSFSDSVPPVAPIAPTGDDVSFEFFEHDVEIEEQMESAFEQQREHNRHFREQQRELAYDLRDLERESRDLAYQLRNVSKKEKKELVEEQKAITKQKVEIKKAREVLAKKSKEMEKKQKISKEKKVAERKKHYQKLTTSLIETLCTYGNSLKSLPKGEHISLVLKSAGDKVANSYQDKILVLTKRDISACVVDKISAEKLLRSTKSYQF